MLTLGLKQYLGLTVSISNGFGLFQQLNYNLSLYFTPGLQSALHTDPLLFEKKPEVHELRSDIYAY